MFVLFVLVFLKMKKLCFNMFICKIVFLLFIGFNDRCFVWMMFNFEGVFFVFLLIKKIVVFVLLCFVLWDFLLIFVLNLWICCFNLLIIKLIFVYKLGDVFLVCKIR